MDLLKIINKMLNDPIHLPRWPARHLVRRCPDGTQESPIAHKPTVAGNLESLAEVAVHIPHPGQLLGLGKVLPCFACEGDKIAVEFGGHFRADGLTIRRTRDIDEFDGV